ncbi:MOSC domain-containing protein [Entomobacter blattae]|uniref:MOSC domain protein n=1 Tax=Entomobacter blattae TaxID=2762277 RepID=A0A7H1NT34_9PROT|nr:MOSC domain-containing protein [Entomobacter blattae]QNT78944.1 MOSC domain protein [Entomobacter blattae]
MTKLLSLLVGNLAPLSTDKHHVVSGIDKTPQKDPQWLGREGFTNDHQGDKVHHGGPEKAVHHYPFEHYALWRQLFGPCHRLARPSAFGENFSTIGITEQTVAVGDVFEIGEAIIEVSQPRQPCWKLNVKFDIPALALKLQTTGMTGWYYRVIQAGFVKPEDNFKCLERKTPFWSIEKINTVVLRCRTTNAELLTELAELPSLSANWKALIQKRLALKHIEDWTDRLNGKNPLHKTEQLTGIKEKTQSHPRPKKL